MLAALIAGGVGALNAVRAQDTTNAPAPATAPLPATPPTPATAPSRPPGPRLVRNPFERISTTLALSEDQKAKAKPIFAEMAQKQTAVVNDSSLDRTAKQAKIKAIREDATAKLKEVLTPDQFDKWQRMMTGNRRPITPPPAAPAPGDAKPPQ